MTRRSREAWVTNQNATVRRGFLVNLRNLLSIRCGLMQWRSFVKYDARPGALRGIRGDFKHNALRGQAERCMRLARSAADQEKAPRH
jgi:hypothetical protein